jgi:dihydropteroate synthase
MGVLNVTPDSFSDGGKYLVAERAIAHGLKMLDEGADILDIGGESTRPPGKDYGEGSKRISAEEEIERVGPVIEGIYKQRQKAVISIDTTKSQVAKHALEYGASILNDVSSGTVDPKIFNVAAERNAPVILMHGYGPGFSKNSIDEYAYKDVVTEVYQFLEQRMRVAKEVGVTQILVDVGIGFAKGYVDNMKLIRDQDAFLKLGVPLVLGVSRKSSIGKAMQRNVTPAERVSGSLAAACYGVLHGTAIVRTHDVRETRDAVNVLEAIQDM